LDLLTSRFIGALFGASHVARRNRRIVFSILASGGARALQMITTLAVMPMAYQSLGVERFGFWMALTSAVTFLAFADLGIGNGLINAIATADARENHVLARIQFSTAFSMLSAVAIVLAGVFVPIFLGVDWINWFNLMVTPSDRQDVRWSVVVAFACFAIQMPLTVASKARAGRQQMYLNSMFDAFGSCAVVFVMFAVVRARGNLTILVLCVSGIPAFMALSNFVCLLWQHPWLRPSLRYFSGAAARELLRVGSLFLLLNVCVAVGFTSDTLVAIRVFGPETAAVFSVGLKLFSICPTAASICLLPLWPAYSEAMLRKDFGWVRRTFVRSVVLSFAASTVLAVLLFFFANSLAAVWLRWNIVLPVSLLAAFAVWMPILAAGVALAMFWNGAGFVRFETAVTVIFSAVAFPAKILLSRAIGPSGIIWATVLCYSMFVVVPSAVVTPKFFRRTRGPS
jgi:O-antigen/teichoic acid export membrane protein